MFISTFEAVQKILSLTQYQRWSLQIASTLIENSSKTKVAFSKRLTNTLDVYLENFY